MNPPSGASKAMSDGLTVSAYGLALIGGGFTAVGVLLGGWLTYRFSLNLARWNAKHEAGARLRAAFAKELGALNPVSTDRIESVDQYLTVAFPKHRDAVGEFAWYLKDTERKLFEQAWKAYYEVGGSVRFYDYMMNGTKQEQFDRFKQRVDAILKFTRD